MRCRSFLPQARQGGHDRPVGHEHRPFHVHEEALLEYRLLFTDFSSQGFSKSIYTVNAFVEAVAGLLGESLCRRVQHHDQCDKDWCHYLHMSLIREGLCFEHLRSMLL